MTERASAPPAFSPYSALGLAIVCVSSSAALTRLTHGAPAGVAAWRLGIAAALLLLAPGALSGLRTADARDFFRMGCAAVFLAVHFGAWIASLRMLPVAISVIVVSTHPLFVLAWRALTGRLPRPTEAVGLVVAVVGVAVMHTGTPVGRLRDASGTPMLGLIMALVGAVSLAAYLLVGASVRRRVPATSYILVVNSAACVALAGFLVGAGGRLAPGASSEYLVYIALALLPTLGGHGLFAYAVGHLPTVVVSTAFLVEPLAATLIAIPAFREIPTPAAFAGGLMALAGLALVVSRPDAPDA